MEPVTGHLKTGNEGRPRTSHDGNTQASVVLRVRTFKEILPFLHNLFRKREEEGTFREASYPPMQNRMRTAQQRTTRTDTPANRDTESWAGRRRARSGDTGEGRCVTTKEGVSRVRPAQRRNTHRRNPPSWKSRRRPRAPFRQFKRKAKGFDKMQHPLVMNHEQEKNRG